MQLRTVRVQCGCGSTHQFEALVVERKRADPTLREVRYVIDGPRKCGSCEEEIDPELVIESLYQRR